MHNFRVKLIYLIDFIYIMKRGALELEIVAKFLIALAVLVVVAILIFIFRDKMIEILMNLKEKMRAI